MTPRLRTPIKYFGGKGKFLSKLLPLFPPHRCYIEPFGGGGSVLLAKEPCRGVEVFNDIDEALYDFFTVLADPEMFEQFYRRVSTLPHSRQFWREYRDRWRAEPDRIKRVAMWFLVAR